MITDPIADFLTQIRNAARAQKAEVVAPYSRIKNDIAQIFKQEGFIKEVEVVKDGSKQWVKVTMKVSPKLPPITQVRRISKPGRRVYVNSREIPRVLGGLGVAVISTSHGVVSGHEAKKLNIGGEVVCYIA